MPKFDKIKHSRHQREQMAKDPGHVCTEAEAESIIDSPLATCVQEEDGRRKYWGLGRGDKIYEIVVSAAVSAQSRIARVVTAHRDRLPKK
jgi:hypothetical protein